MSESLAWPPRSRAGDELARRVGRDRGRNGTAEAARSLREHVCEVMLAQANRQRDRLRDIIVNDRRDGCRLRDAVALPQSK